MDAVDTFEHFGIAVEIYYDGDARDPYEEFEQASRLVWLASARRRHGMRDVETTDDERVGAAVCARYLTLFGGESVAIPFEFEDYGSSGYRARIGCELDRASGFAVVSRDKVAEEWPAETTIDGETFTAVEMAERCARDEFGTWRAWLEGRVYGYAVAADTPEQGGCWGYYGEEEYVRDEAKGAAEWAAFERARRVSATRRYLLDPSPPVVPASFDEWKLAREGVPA